MCSIASGFGDRHGGNDQGAAISATAVLCLRIFWPRVFEHLFFWWRFVWIWVFFTFFRIPLMKIRGVSACNLKINAPTDLIIFHWKKFLLLSFQGATVKVEYGDATTTIDPTCANVVAQAFPRTYGQPLVSFVAPPPDTVDKDRAPIRSQTQNPPFDRSTSLTDL